MALFAKLRQMACRFRNYIAVGSSIPTMTESVSWTGESCLSSANQHWAWYRSDQSALDSCSSSKYQQRSRYPLTGPASTSKFDSIYRSACQLTSHLSGHLVTIVFILYLVRLSECCSSRAKPRRPIFSSRPTLPPNYGTGLCPPNYARHYCLNDGTCFSASIGNNVMYNCVCSGSFRGQRCEFKSVTGSYPHVPRVDVPRAEPDTEQVLECANVSMATLAIVAGGLLLILALFIIGRWRSRQKNYELPVSNPATVNVLHSIDSRSEKVLPSILSPQTTNGSLPAVEVTDLECLPNPLGSTNKLEVNSTSDSAKVAVCRV